ncbi:hypothetical protein [Luteibaculum oceani]|uniref:Uncharacterized protein n=1 Tax=Luteibaculum oceani TaxID=1294296 RepID=A0A5C6VIE4_9FLAO|nr:hypothetical protein [Luteibaculum oceani]TXC85312.1 hypothetical protein FRX97_01420 [Luteibaculum oceani]
MAELQKPQPPKGDSPETWKATIRAFNMVFEDVVFEGYSKRQLDEWVKHEIIDTAEITEIERIGLTDEDNENPKRSNKEIVRDLIHEKLEFYQNQIENLERVIKESEQQASIFGDDDQYNQARKRDIERYKTLIEELKILSKAEIIVND